MKKMSNDVVKAVTSLEDDHLRTLGATISCTWLATIGWHERGKRCQDTSLEDDHLRTQRPAAPQISNGDICVHTLLAAGVEEF